MNRLILFFLILYCWGSKSQQKNNLYGSFFSNGVYYGESEDNDFNEDLRTNNYLKLDYLVGEKWNFDLQIESYAIDGRLQNFSENLKGTFISTFSANYKINNLKFSVGSIYDQFGSGLVFRTWEDRQLGINNSIWGVRTTYSTEKFNLTGLAGKQKKGKINSDGFVYGFDADLMLFENFDNYKSLNLGLSYVGRSEPEIEYSFNNLTSAISARVDYNSESFYINYEHVSKSKDGIVQFGSVNENFIKNGKADLMNFGLFKSGFGLDINLRRMENMSFFSDRNEFGKEYLEATLNYLPALTKQHDYLLTNINVYVAQPNVSFQDPELMKSGEIGYQVDLFYNFKKGSPLGGKYGTKLSFNSALWYNLGGDYDYNNQNYNTSFLDFDEKYFSEQSIELSKKFNNKYNATLLYVNRYYNKRFVEEKSGEVNSQIIVLDNTLKFGNKKSLKFDIQHLSNDDDQKNWFGYGIEYNLNYNISVYHSNIVNYGNEIEGKPSYYSTGISYSKNSTRLSTSFGKERGGYNCYGGICKYIPEFKGISFSVSTTF